MSTPAASRSARPSVAEAVGTPVPIVGAPMAGGATTPELAAAVAAAGGFPMLAGGYLTAAALAEQIAALRALLPAGEQRFGVNLFVPQHTRIDDAVFADYAEALTPLAAELGAHLDPSPVLDDDDHFAAKLEHLLTSPVDVVTLTFGLPAPEVVERLHAVGTCVLATVTSPAEAQAAAALGCDGLIAQGSSAGGHAGTHDPLRGVEDTATAELVRAIAAALDLPIIAAGGVDGPAAVAELLAAGALAVQVGTLLLRCPEAGTSAVHRAALADPAYQETALTRAFTGRLARGLRNRFIDEFSAAAPPYYPQLHHLTKPLRTAAAQADRPAYVHLWAGTGWRAAREAPVAEVIAWLSGDVSRSSGRTS